MDKPQEKKCELPKFIQGEMVNVNSHITIKEIESEVNNLPMEKPGPVSVASNFRQIFFKKVSLQPYSNYFSV